MTCADGCSWRFVRRAELDDPRRAELGCSDPLELACRRDGCGRSYLAACGTAQEKRCQSCSRAYRERLSIVAGGGYRGMRHSPDGVYLVTVTAPGAAPHLMPGGAVCPCTRVQGTDLAAWNGSAARRWGHFVEDLRAELGDLQLFKGTEVQRRGALHFHAIIRQTGYWEQPISVGLVRELAIANGFGHSVDVQRVRTDQVQGERPKKDAATYVAKYVTKSASDRVDVPWRGIKRQQGKPTRTGDGELLGYLYAGGVLHDRPRREVVSGRPSFRTWSASRQWGETVKAVRAAQRHWRAVQALLEPDDSNAPEIAVLAPQRPDYRPLVPV